MLTETFTDYIDFAQISIWGFWLFFGALILYLRREDKREGYPLESDTTDAPLIQGYPTIPEPKVFKLIHGGTYEAPNDAVDERPIAGEPSAPWPGAPLEPTGNPMLDGIGPAAWAERSTEPERTVDGEPRIVPMRVAQHFSVESRDPDPRGMPVIGADGEVGGSVRDLWVDRAEPQVRYVEVEVAGAEGRCVLVPIALASVSRSKGHVKVESVLAEHFAQAPTLSNPDQVSQLEEDRTSAYFASGHMYATPERQEPLL